MRKILVSLLVISMVLLSGCNQTAQEELGEPGGSPQVEAVQPGASSAEEDILDLVILYEQDDSMINNYSLLAVNPGAPFVDADGNTVTDVAVNSEGAIALINWLLSDETEKMAANYGYEAYGEYLFYLKDSAPVNDREITAATDDTRTIRMSTTTSVNDSGLLDYLLPTFEETYGYDVEVYSAGTGKAIANAKAGNADLILVHSKSQEEAFVADGFSYVLDGYTSERLTFLYNYFVLCGPSADPAKVTEQSTVKNAFAAIAAGAHTFVSRGDNSGTHTKELSLWAEDLQITAEAESVKEYNWYVYSNAGMGTCLTMAEEMGGYILSDKATFLTFQTNGGKM